jgi:predicted phosphodiesterase
MRIGILADVHANLPALQVALRQVADAGCQRILVAGDLVGYGASPNECVELLIEAGAICVAGNHDLYMLDRLPPDRFSATARRAAELTRPLIGRSAMEFLASLPTLHREGALLMAHGSLDDPEEYVEDRRRATDLLRQVVEREPGASTLVLGHTHHQRTIRSRSVDAGSRPARLINPGSVGQSRAREHRPRVRLAVLEGPGARPHFFQLHYDVVAAHERLRAIGLDSSCLHSPESISRRLGGRLPGGVRGRLRHLRTKVTTVMSATE